MRKSLYTYIAISTACLSLSATYAADLAQLTEDATNPALTKAERGKAKMEYINQMFSKIEGIGPVIAEQVKENAREQAKRDQDAKDRAPQEFKYDVMTQADYNLKKYVGLVMDAERYVGKDRNIHFRDNHIAEKTINEINLATSPLVDTSVNIYGIATKETNQWYLNFARMKGHNLAARLEGDKKYDLDNVFGILKYEFNMTTVQDESVFKADPAAKLRFQLMVLTSYSALEYIGGTLAFARLKTSDRFAGFQHTLNDLQGFLKNIEDTKIPVEFRQVVEQIYNEDDYQDTIYDSQSNLIGENQGQKHVIYCNGYKIIKSSINGKQRLVDDYRDEERYINSPMWEPDLPTLLRPRVKPTIPPFDYTENLPSRQTAINLLKSKPKHWTQSGRPTQQ